MKQFIILFCASVIASLCINAATRKFEVKKVDFAQIKADTYNPKSKAYYPRLMQSYMSHDTTMTFDDYRNLYYGYVFQEDYSPFRTSDYSSKIEDLYYKKDYSRADCDSIEKYAALSLDDNIFDLRQMKFFIFALKQKQKNARAAIRQYRLNHLVAAILSSGTGTKESPWVVISMDHEYNILNFLGYVATDHKELDGNIDYITVNKKDDKSPEGFYFDVSKIVEMSNLKYPGNRKK